MIGTTVSVTAVLRSTSAVSSGTATQRQADADDALDRAAGEQAERAEKQDESGQAGGSRA